jgi:hypothetical protein
VTDPIPKPDIFPEFVRYLKCLPFPRLRDCNIDVSEFHNHHSSIPNFSFIHWFSTEHCFVKMAHLIYIVAFDMDMLELKFHHKIPLTIVFQLGMKPLGDRNATDAFREDDIAISS